MSRFDDFVDEFVFMAKNAADVATKKTGEVLETSKLRYQLKQVEWEIEKAYAKLGAILYESKKNSDNYEEVIQLAISEVDDLKERFDEINDKLRNYKNASKCPNCSRENDISDSFCSRCGAPLVNEDPAPEEPQDFSEDEEPKF